VEGVFVEKPSGFADQIVKEGVKIYVESMWKDCGKYVERFFKNTQ
jgi:Uri superfamily endonuclease